MATPALQAAPAELSQTALVWRRMRSHKGFLAGATLLVLIVTASLLAPFIAPHDPYLQDLTKRMIPPIWEARGQWAHPLGTDNLGRDYLSRVLWGGQISLLIGLSVMVISGIIGAGLGLAAGYFGGRIDLAITFIITTRLALPVVLVALAVVAMISGSLLVVILILGLLKWDRFAGGHALGNAAGARAGLCRRSGSRRGLHAAHHPAGGSAECRAAN